MPEQFPKLCKLIGLTFLPIAAQIPIQMKLNKQHAK
jgi:hypothetical protein